MEISTNEVSNKIFLADGGFAKVYSATFKNQKVAVKELKERTETTRKMFRKEILLIRSLIHPNIVRLLAYCAGPEALFMVLELATCSLETFWPEVQGSAEELEFQMKTICLDVAKALEYIHGSHVIHHDLKPGNILLKLGEKNGVLSAMISDFGISKTALATTTKSNTGGTYSFSAPELLIAEEEEEEDMDQENNENAGQKSSSQGQSSNKSEGHGFKAPHFPADIFSFAMVMYFLCSKKYAWTGKSIPQIVQLTMAGKRPVVNKEWKDWAKVLMTKCWDQEPLKRPTASMLVKELQNSFINWNWTCKKHGVGRHTTFLSYRVKYESDLAEKIALRLENQLLKRVLERNGLDSNSMSSVFLDCDCLKEGEDWRDGFISGIRQSRSEILLVSRESFEHVIQNASTTKDNVLIEWEESMNKESTKKMILYIDDEGKEFKPFGLKLPDVEHLGSGIKIKDTIERMFSIQGKRVVRGRDYKEIIPSLVDWIETKVESETDADADAEDIESLNTKMKYENKTDKEIEEEIKQKLKEVTDLRKELLRRRNKENGKKVSQGTGPTKSADGSSSQTNPQAASSQSVQSSQPQTNTQGFFVHLSLFVLLPLLSLPLTSSISLTHIFVPPSFV